ncbi:helix-turn-helix domain-containing protein [Staphylococcus sp. SQ8-PEA]|uniref:Helix-turn-helix domain-containing protein n=1 Tax=Staphylococcus marylandisciuri TaxID=2981529 RepID=A0ABT2QMZ0_9STAP|nr:helix-turn-helix transcriptional regulator [Staphylococcus marylandisciuri]MCU5745343.1 helix-turn-helix domain-containing protein [Staphylococcus marylandisciuri]
MEITTLNIHEELTTGIQRCIDEVIILFPLSEPFTLQLNGQKINIYSGIIINNADLYQVEDAQHIVELRLPLSLLLKREDYSPYCYFDYSRITSSRELKKLILRDIDNTSVNRIIPTTTVLKLVDVLLIEARVELQHPYIPEIVSDTPIFNKILKFTNNNISSNLSTKMLAQEFYISQSYISILFSQKLSMNFKQYLNSLRVALALLDLIQPNQTIHTVAAKYDFLNLSTFTKQFKRYLNQTPKKFINNYRTLMIKTKNPLKISVENLPKLIEEIEVYTQNVFTNHFEVLNLENVKSHQHIEALEIMINVEDLNQLYYYTDKLFLNFTSEIFDKPNLVIQNFDTFGVQRFDSYQNVQSLLKLLNKGCRITLKIDKASTYYALEEKLNQLIWAGTLTNDIVKNLIILLDSKMLSLRTVSLLRHRATMNFPDLQFALIIDYYLFHSTQQDYFLDTLQSLNLSYYFIESELTTLKDRICEVDRSFKSDASLQTTVAQFTELFAKDSSKLVLNNLTHSSFRDYYQSSVDTSYTHSAKFYIEMCRKVGGLGFYLHSTKPDQIKLLTSYESYRPIVHIYSLLKPFIGQRVTVLPYGLVCKINKKYHLLLYGGYRFENDENISLAIKVQHTFTKDFLLFSRTLNYKYGTIDHIISNKLKNIHINPQMLRQLNDSNYPRAELVLYNWAKPLEINLSYQTLKYISLTINE